MVVIRSLLGRTWSTFLVQTRLAGHSKWANIKHTKAANDSARSLRFGRFSQLIKMKIQEKGDANIETNRALHQIVESAKRASMPISSIQNAIKVAQINKSKCEECCFEIKGPSGSFIIAVAITDNKKRTKDTIASILRKNNVSFTEKVARVLFSRKGLIEAEAPAGVDNFDKILEHAIESGAEEVSPNEEREGDDNPGGAPKDHSYLFYCEAERLEEMRRKLEGFGYRVLDAEAVFISHNHVSLDDQNLAAVSKLCDKLEEHPDIIKLYDNIM